MMITCTCCREMITQPGGYFVNLPAVIELSDRLIYKVGHERRGLCPGCLRAIERGYEKRKNRRSSIITDISESNNNRHYGLKRAELREAYYGR